jgi:hypothetical protein
MTLENDVQLYVAAPVVLLPVWLDDELARLLRAVGGRAERVQTERRAERPPDDLGVPPRDRLNLRDAKCGPAFRSHVAGLMVPMKVAHDQLLAVRGPIPGGRPK